MATTIPSAQTSAAFTGAGVDIMSGQTAQGQGTYQLGALENQAKNETIPKMEDAAGANGRWFGGPAKVAEGNLDASIKNQGFNIYSGMFDTMNQMTYNQGAAAVGYSAG